MRKILLIICLFLCCINVYASESSFAGSEYLDDIYYMKDNGGIRQYRKAQVIRNNETGDIAYCIEPFGRILDNNSYSETEVYDPIFQISLEAWEKVKLYAYYGYGYKNHQGKEWISITQMSIWRTIEPNSRFLYIDNSGDGNILDRFNDEFDEINNLVNNHTTLPSFEKEYTYTVGETISLNDSNNVLNNYTIINSDFESNISNNTLTINTGSTQKEGYIELERGSEKFPNNVKYFYSSTSQNLMERGNITPVRMKLKISVKTGKIIVNKVDSETGEKIPQGEASLDGSIFELLNERKEVIKELEVKDNTLEFDSLVFGKYYIREKKPGVGYYLNQKEYEVVIDENNLEKEITIGNEVMKSNVRIIKMFGTKADYEKDEMKREKDIEFIIYDKDKNIIYKGITNEEGVIEVNLPFGNYVLEQINTTDGYNKNDNYSFSINEENSVSYDIVLYDFKIEVPNASKKVVSPLMNILMELIYV